jgi:hypothetical protein
VRGVMGSVWRVAMVLLLAIPVRPVVAATTTYYQAGNWHAFSGTDGQRRLLCGIGADDPVMASSLELRIVIGQPQLLFQASKLTWKIPPDTPIPIVMQLPGTVPWALQAVGHDHEVDWALDADQLSQFDAAFRAAPALTLDFPAGNERSWQVSLAGSTAADNTFRVCIDDMRARLKAARAASASSAGPTQPYGAPATQPFAPQVTATPLGPPGTAAKPSNEALDSSPGPQVSASTPPASGQSSVNPAPATGAPPPR